MLTQEQLKQRLHYNPDTGVFTWIDTKRGQAGTVNTSGYLVIEINYKKYKASQLAHLYMTDYLPQYPKDIMDHISGDNTDNRWSNLRMVDSTANNQNVAKRKDASTHGTGIRLLPSGKFSYSFSSNKVRYTQGSFNTAEEAMTAKLSKMTDVGSFTPRHGM
ncbi:hypothetical protein AB4259_02780 [Vibrio amylolyticus]|uniref:hypothetical protein n=1 Tax=Vibrio amylolyticus TaxID=2847292 RepID=UPI0035528AB7